MTGLRGSIIGANGDILNCDVENNSGPYHLANDPGIFGSPPVDIEVVNSAGLTAGDIHGRARHLAKPVRWSINVAADTPDGLYQALQRLSRAVDPVVPGTNERRSCRLQVTRPDGTARQIVATYSTGLTAITPETATINALRANLLFRCAEPYWASVEGSEAYVVFPITGTGAVATPFSDPGTLFSAANVPFNGFTSTEVENTASTTLTVQGDAQSWPLWRVQGAAASVEVINRATGRRWSWVGTLAPGQELVIDTLDSHPTARLDGANAWGGMVSGSDTFPLVPGDNRIVFKVTGADTGSSMSVEWQDRWLTP